MNVIAQQLSLEVQSQFSLFLMTACKPCKTENVKQRYSIYFCRGHNVTIKKKKSNILQYNENILILPSSPICHQSFSIQLHHSQCNFFVIQHDLRLFQRASSASMDGNLSLDCVIMGILAFWFVSSLNIDWMLILDHTLSICGADF